MKLSAKLLLIILLAGIASIGTIPYGYQFGKIIIPNISWLAVVAGVMFASSAALANIILGAYSFINFQKDKQKTDHATALKIVSLISALPVGSICFFAYQDILPLLMALGISVTVTLINAAIGYTAIANFLITLKNSPEMMQAHVKFSFRMLGFIVGITVSLTAFMAATQALVSILKSLTSWSESSILNLSTLIGFIAWTPSAFLFANSMQLVVGNCYTFFSNLRREIKNIDRVTIGLLIFSLCSGSAYSQMAIVFFNPDMNIPLVFKHVYFQHYIYPVLVSLAFISSSSVNYCVLQNMFSVLKSKNK